MRRAPPSAALVRYLDEELCERVAGATTITPAPPPTFAPLPLTRHGSPAPGLVAAVVLLFVILSPCLASLAFGQSLPAGPARVTQVCGGASPSSHGETGGTADTVVCQDDSDCGLSNTAGSLPASLGLFSTGADATGSTPTLREPAEHISLARRARLDGHAEIFADDRRRIRVARFFTTRQLWNRACASALLLAIAAAIATWRRSRARRPALAGSGAKRPRGAVATRRGARARNEDYGVTRALGDVELLLIADGLGGHIGGGRAARLAVRAAAEALEHRVRSLAVVDAEHVECLVRQAFAAAATALREEDEELGLAAHGHDALRTTLITCIALDGEYVVGAIGDGAALVRRADGTIEPMMQAQKAGAQNVLAASLGPETDGDLTLRVHARRAGDVVILATDGIADRVSGDDFWHGVAAYLSETQSARVALDDVLDEFERIVPPGDNATIAALFTPLGKPA